MLTSELTALPSLPSRERGLKFEKSGKTKFAEEVAPLAGARIEIGNTGANLKYKLGRSPRGSED